jgi:hypothetical protein
VLRAATNWVLFYLFYLQKALRNKAMDMPEPTQWDNEDSENTTAVELKDPLDSVPCTESEDSEGSDENFVIVILDPFKKKFNYRELIVFFFHACSLRVI